MLRSRWALLLLAFTIVPAAFADYFTPGNPCLGERSTYYSEAAHTVVVGVNEFICYEGHRVWGYTTNYYVYENFGPCCSVCIASVCGIEP